MVSTDTVKVEGKGIRYYLEDMKVLAPYSGFFGTIMGRGVGTPGYGLARVKI